MEPISWFPLNSMRKRLQQAVTSKNEKLCTVSSGRSRSLLVTRVLVILHAEFSSSVPKASIITPLFSLYSIIDLPTERIEDDCHMFTDYVDTIDTVHIERQCSTFKIS